MTTLSTRNRKQLDRFLFRIMEPLSEEVLTDTHYNSLARNSLREAWDKARLTTDYFQAKHALIFAEMIYKIRVVGCSDVKEHAYEQERLDIVDQLRAAVAVQIMTPAPDLAAVDWKKRKVKDKLVRYGSLTTEQIMARIAEDEAFLAAHPITKRPRRDRGKRKEPVDKSNNGHN